VSKYQEKQKVYLIPYYNDTNSNEVFTYLFLKELTNPYSSPIIVKNYGYPDKFSLGANKLWFAGGCPYPFGGNLGRNTISQCLKNELDEESHGKILIEHFSTDWSSWSNSAWTNCIYKKCENQTYYMLPLNTRLDSRVVEESKQTSSLSKVFNKMSFEKAESTGIIVELRLSILMSQESIVKQIKSRYDIGKDRLNQSKIAKELDECLGGLRLNKSKLEEAKKVFFTKLVSWNPEEQFRDSHTLQILEEIYGLVNHDQHDIIQVLGDTVPTLVADIIHDYL